jgi:hypothetical protein
LDIYQTDYVFKNIKIRDFINVKANNSILKENSIQFYFHYFEYFSKIMEIQIDKYLIQEKEISLKNLEKEINKIKNIWIDMKLNEKKKLFLQEFLFLF